MWLCEDGSLTLPAKKARAEGPYRVSTRLCEDGIASTRLDRRTAAQRGKDGPRLRPTPCGDERRMRRETLLCEDGPRAEGPYRALSAKKAAPTATDPTLSAASSPVGGKKSRLRGEGKDGGAPARQHGWIGGRLRREEKTAVRLRRETLMNRRAAARLRPTPRWKEKTAAARQHANVAGSEGGRTGRWLGDLPPCGGEKARTVLGGMGGEKETPLLYRSASFLSCLTSVSGTWPQNRPAKRRGDSPVRRRPQRRIRTGRGDPLLSAFPAWWGCPRPPTAGAPRR